MKKNKAKQKFTSTGSSTKNFKITCRNVFQSRRFAFVIFTNFKIFTFFENFLNLKFLSSIELITAIN